MDQALAASKAGVTTRMVGALGEDALAAIAIQVTYSEALYIHGSITRPM